MGVDRRLSLPPCPTLVSMTGGTRADKERGALDDIAGALLLLFALIDGTL